VPVEIFFNLLKVVCECSYPTSFKLFLFLFLFLFLRKSFKLFVLPISVKLLQYNDLYFLSDTLQVVVAKEAVGDLGCLVRQLSLDQFENESRRMHPNNDQSYSAKKALNRQRSPQGLHKKVRFRY
jgi:hypothetical protein